MRLTSGESGVSRFVIRAMLTENGTQDPRRLRPRRRRPQISSRQDPSPPVEGLQGPQRLGLRGEASCQALDALVRRIRPRLATLSGPLPFVDVLRSCFVLRVVFGHPGNVYVSFVCSWSLNVARSTWSRRRRLTTALLPLHRLFALVLHQLGLHAAYTPDDAPSCPSRLLQPSPSPPPFLISQRVPHLTHRTMPRAKAATEADEPLSRQVRTQSTICAPEGMG